tara:strand:+ start:250 stop:396 length:147 start_codon:yes stop_codon:yes gene_type:complete
MKYLSKEIEALSKGFEESKSLVQKNNKSCGIFQNNIQDPYIIDDKWDL